MSFGRTYSSHLGREDKNEETRSFNKDSQTRQNSSVLLYHPAPFWVFETTLCLDLNIVPGLSILNILQSFDLESKEWRFCPY